MVLFGLRTSGVLARGNAWSSLSCSPLLLSRLSCPSSYSGTLATSLSHKVHEFIFELEEVQVPLSQRLDPLFIGLLSYLSIVAHYGNSKSLVPWTLNCPSSPKTPFKTAWISNGRNWPVKRIWTLSRPSLPIKISWMLSSPTSPSTPIKTAWTLKSLH